MNRTETMLKRLVPCQRKAMIKGDTLFHQGDPIAQVYVIHRGRIKLVRSTVDGNAVVLQVAMAGDLLAEASLFFDTYHCSALVDSKRVELSCFSRIQLLAACQQSSSAAMQLAELFAHRIRKLRAIMEIRNIRSAKQRIYAFLQLEANADRDVLLQMTYKDMAYQLGLAHETFYRAMKQLEVEKRIEKKSHCIHLFL